MAALSTVAMEYPFTRDKVAALRLGQFVNLTGRVFACRDRVHKFLFEGGEPPVMLKDGAIYHCGPAVVSGDGGWIVRAAGPTTSAREEPYMEKIIRTHHVRVIIGKGGMGERTRRACAAYGCVYLQAVGGAAQMLAQRIRTVNGVHFAEEFGTSEALWDLGVEAFPAVVAIDAAGRSLFRRVEAASRSALRRVLAAGAFRE